MNHSPIFGSEATLRPPGAVFGVYSGVETATRFTDTREEFAALTSGCGIYDLGWRAKLLVRGEDRTRWLNSMLTNNIKELPVNRGNYSFVLNPQGRIQGDIYAYNRGDFFLLDTEASQLEKLKALFDHYIIMDDVEIEDASNKLTAIGVQGPSSHEILRKAGIEFAAVEPAQVIDLTWQQTPLSVTRMVNEHYETYELWIATEKAATLWNALLAVSGKPVGTDTLEKFRVMMGMPKYGTDIRDRDLPQETKQEQALNFTKGCYIGQEIVERIRSRGAVHRQFVGFSIEGEPPTSDTKITASEKEAGEITSVNTLPGKSGHDHMVALGYLRREAIDKKLELTYPGGKLTVSRLPFPLD